MIEFESKLRALVRSASTRIPADKDIPVARLYELVGLLVPATPSRKTLIQDLYERIRRLLQWRDPATGLDTTILGRHLELRFLADGQLFLPMIRAVDVVHDAVRVAGSTRFLAAPLSEAARWKEALPFILDCNALHPEGPSRRVRFDPRATNVADAIKVLRTQRVEAKVREGRVSISDAELHRIREKIEANIQRVGGGRFITRTFEELQPRYFREHDRYHVAQAVAPYPYESAPPLRPHGWLLGLALRHLETTAPPASAESIDNAYKDAVALASAFADSLDIRALSFAEGLWNDTYTLLQFMNRVSLFDTLYTFEQGRRTEVVPLLKDLFSWVPATERFGRGWTVQEFIDVVHAIFQELGENSGIRIVGVAPLLRHLGDSFNPEVVKRVLDDLAHDPGRINRHFLMPWHRAKYDFYNLPLVADRARRSHFLLESSWCAPAFYSALAKQVTGKLGENTDRKLGAALEDHVRKAFSSRGIATNHGVFKVGELGGDCDVVIETEDRIVLIEVKKKHLTNEAKGGDTVQLLWDLALALFTSQGQLARAAFLLHRDGQLELRKGREPWTLFRRGRQIERVSLTLADYGCLHDLKVFPNLLKLVPGVPLEAKSAHQQPALERVLKEGEKFRAIEERLVALTGESFGAPGVHLPCRFISLGQLQVMLDHASNNEEFWRELLRTRQVSYSTMSFYNEYRLARQRSVPTPDTSGS